MKAHGLALRTLAACMQLPCLGRSLGHVCVIGALSLAAGAYSPAAYAEDYDIIIEKNLFHDQRLKWEIEKEQPKASETARPEDQQNIDQINLFGTVIMDSRSYAVMRISPQKAKRAVRSRSRRVHPRKPQGKPSEDSKQPYAVGDFISGYKVVEIKTGSVLLQDTYDNSLYEIFISDGQVERAAIRTDIPEESPKAPSGKDDALDSGKKSPRRSASRSTKPPPAAAANFMRQRFEKDLQMLRDDASDAAAQRAERDWKKLEPMLSALDDKEREEVMRLRREFERLRQ